MNVITDHISKHEFISYGVMIEWNPNHRSKIASFAFNPDELKQAILKQWKNLEFQLDSPNKNVIVTYDWSTDIAFDGHEGGGYIFTFKDAVTPGRTYMTIYVEWFDTHTSNMGLVERKDDRLCVDLGVNTASNFIARLSR